MAKDESKNQIFAQRLNEALLVRKVSAAELSRRTNIGQDALSRYRKGECTPKSIRVFDISKALGVNPTWLLGFSDDMLFQMSEIDAARNELENLISDLDEKQIKKTIDFIRNYII